MNKIIHTSNDNQFLNYAHKSFTQFLNVKNEFLIFKETEIKSIS